MTSGRVRVAAVAMALLSLAVPVAAGPSEVVPMGELFERAVELDGTVVRIEGEAIGQPMARGDHAWINVEDDSGAIGVWLDVGTARAVTTFGSYAAIGDTVLVTGVFHRACPEHGGDTDLHADSATVTLAGHPVEHPVPAGRWVAASVSAVLAAASMAAYLVRNAAAGSTAAGSPATGGADNGDRGGRHG